MEIGNLKNHPDDGKYLCPNDMLLLGGGVGLLFKETTNVNSQITDTFESFEYMDPRLRCL